MSSTTDLKQYLKQIQCDIMPKSEIELYGYNRIGQYLLRESDLKQLNSEDIGSSQLYRHEKAHPNRYLIKSKSNPDELYPVYMKFNKDGVRSTLAQIIVNSTLNIFPTPLQAHGVSHESNISVEMGIETIDLNYLKNAETNEKVESIRLDILLHTLGFDTDIKSFCSFQEMIKSGKLSEKLTARAIVQLGLAKIFIPNAIGETDPNSRNILLLRDKNSDKYDIVVRIDADKNKYLDKTKENEDFLPTGILTPYESMEDYLKIIMSRDVRVDWELFAGFNVIARELCSRTNIDEAITNSYKSNSFKFNVNMDMVASPYVDDYNLSAFADFSEFIINNSTKHFADVFNALGYVRENIPFSEGSKKYGNISVQDNLFGNLEQQKFDLNGHEM